MAKIVKEADYSPHLRDVAFAQDRFYVWCPGCYEAYKLRYPGGEDDRGWWINGALHAVSNKVHQITGTPDAPTLSPSLLVQYELGEEKTPYVCHSFIVDGRIQYLGDCTHPLKNQTVDLLDVPERAPK